MDLQINCTQDGIKKYPVHKHNYYEIMLYLNGTGYLYTREKNYPFCPGSVIIVPPGIEHGSISEKGFQNISIGGAFDKPLYFDKPVTLTDNAQKDGTALATLIYNNRYGNNEYLAKLCSAYTHFLLQNLKIESALNAAVNTIINEITDGFHNSELCVSDLLKESGYAEDYIRACFKKVTEKTPVAFLTDIRIKHACFLIDVYMDTLSLQQIAQQCGYTDYVYFSKKFKAIMGISPQQYKNMVKNNV